MPAPSRESNRGPAAAAANHRALLGAARRLFAERGYHVPLNAIAREAGVGQGVLYRHFPTRLDLAFAVFEENFVELEEIAEDSGAGAFERLWGRLIELTLDSFGFVELVVDARRNLPEFDGDRRLARMVDDTLGRAQSAGAVRSTVTRDEVLLGLRMVYGVAATAPDVQQARTDVERARRWLLSEWMP